PRVRADVLRQGRVGHARWARAPAGAPAPSARDRDRQGGGRARRLGPDGDLGPDRARAVRGGTRRRLPGRDARTRGQGMKQRASKEALRGELRQSLSLIAMTAATAATFLGLGLLTAHLLG